MMRSKARFILSRKVVLSQYDLVRKQADIVSYSYKTNFRVGSVLESETDSMFSVHSVESVQMLADHGRIIFFGQAWDNDEIRKLLDLGVSKFVVDNEMDLKTLLSCLDKHHKIWLFLRMRLREHTVHTGKHFVFGMYSDRLKQLIPELSEDERIEKLGIHFHRKTQNMSEWSLKYELESILTPDILHCLDLVNIGGGIPAMYKNFRIDVIDTIFARIRELKDWLNSHGIRMIIEPGRFIAAPSIVLEAAVMNVYDGNIVVNCSVWNSAMDTFIANIRLLVEGELPEGQGVMYTIKGSTPDSMDILRYRVFLPEKKAGDVIRFLNAGAYNFHTDFCNLPELETVIE